MTRTTIQLTNLSLVLALTLFGSATLLAQSKGKPIELSIKQVNDRRTNGSFGGLTIGLELPGIANRDVAASRVLVKKAVDDSGRSLLDPNSQEPALEANPYLNYDNEETLKSPASMNVSLLSPDRNATEISEVSGEIELYMPAKDSTSVALLPKYASSKGKPFSHKALKANGVEITALTEKQFEAEKKRLADAKRKSAVEEGYEGEMIDQVVSSFLEMFFTPSESDVVLRVKDPKGRLQQISFVDGSGKQKQTSMRDEEGMTVLSTWETPAADWGLKVSMKTPKNVVKQPFALTSVALP